MGNLAFQVVFQRAMVQAIHALTAAQAPFAVHAGFPEAAEDEGGAFVNAAVDLYNARLAPILAGGLDIDGALLGAGVTAVGRVDFRKTRVPVIAGFFVYLALLPGDWWHTAPADAELRSWLESAWSHIGPGPRQGLPGLFSRHGSQWRKGLSDVALARQLANDEDVLLNLAMERIRAALSAS